MSTYDNYGVSLGRRAAVSTESGLTGSSTIVNSALGVMDSEHVSMDGMGADYTSFGTSGDYSALLNGLNSDTSDRAYQDLVGYHEHERTRTDIDLSSYLDSSTGNSYSKLPRQHYQQ